MDPISRMAVSGPARTAGVEEPSQTHGPVVRRSARNRTQPVEKQPPTLRLSPPPLTPLWAQPSPRASPPAGISQMPLTPITPATPAWPAPMGRSDGRKVQSCDSDGEMPDAPCAAYLKEANALARIVRRSMPAVFGLLYDGDDDEALFHELRRTPFDVYAKGGPMQVSSIMLAHRLNRVHCAKMLFEYEFDKTTAMPWPIASTASWSLQQAIARSNLNRGVLNARLKERLYVRCIGNIQASIQGDAKLMCYCTKLLQDDLDGHDGGPMATEGQRVLVNYWTRAGILGHLLNHFDQDALEGGRNCSHWPKLLSATAQALGYPLDKDHLLIGFGLPACGGAPERD